MQLYAALPIWFTYQNFGSAWLGILRGPTESIQEAFNGLYNLAATNGEFEFGDHLETIGVFWTEWRQMRRYFFNRYYMPRCDGNTKGQGKLARSAMRYALAQLDLLAESCHESYLVFEDKSMPETYGSGMICAERPDSDMKDAILANAFQEKESSVSKAVDFEKLADSI